MSVLKPAFSFTIFPTKISYAFQLRNNNRKYKYCATDQFTVASATTSMETNSPVSTLTVVVVP
jgi:hypothetical protein